MPGQRAPPRVLPHLLKKEVGRCCLPCKHSREGQEGEARVALSFQSAPCGPQQGDSWKAVRGKGASLSWLGLVLPLWLVKEKCSQILVSVTTPSKGRGLVLSPSAFTFEIHLTVQATLAWAWGTSALPLQGWGSRCVPLCLALWQLLASLSRLGLSKTMPLPSSKQSESLLMLLIRYTAPISVCLAKIKFVYLNQDLNNFKGWFNCNWLISPVNLF